MPKNRCPGEGSCTYFYQAAGANREEKEIEVCTGGNVENPVCQFFSSKPPPGEAIDALSDSEAVEGVGELVSEIADIVSWEDAGSATDWTLYPFETRMLYRIWRDAEKRIAQIQAARMQMFIKSFRSAS